MPIQLEKTVQKIPFLRLSIALVTGIFVASSIEFTNQSTFIAFAFFLAGLLLLNHFYSYKLSTLFGIGVHILLFFLGVTVYSFHNKGPKFYPNGKYTATILETPVEKANSRKSLLRINAFIKNDSVFPTNEKMLVYFSKQANVASLEPGDVIIFNASPQLITNFGNPFEFDYKKFLQQKNIYRQVYLSSQSWKKTNLKSSFSLKMIAEKTRTELLEIYRNKIPGDNEMNIISALTLGYKAELDPQTKQTFSSSGAMHVLAVSGLHVGIIFWVLTSLLSFLKKYKTGKIVFVLIIVASLWVYAFLTGLSPSVSRAATMFSFLVTGTNMNRQVNIYNSLAGSAFFLLLINPNNLSEVGFQLSYSAVFGIVFLQPKFDKLVIIKNKIPRFFWQLLTVSVAAQIATFPFTIYYFNQFPTYFWISNLFVIPVVMVLIPLGFLLLIFSSVSIISAILSFCIHYLIFGMFKMLLFIESFPYSVFHVSISTVEFVLILSILFSFFIFLNKLNNSHLKTSLVFTLFLFIFSMAVKIDNAFQKELIVYNHPENIVIHLISGKTNYIVSEKKMKHEDFSFTLINTTVKKLMLKTPIYLTCNDNFKDGYFFQKNGIMKFEGKTILFSPDLNSFPKTISPDILINPLNFNEIPNENELNYKIVTNKKENITNEFYASKFHFLEESGAYIKKW